MPITTRTLGPLHFEDLEPHRFEDLVRQLIYDFRQWRNLEATGRSGSDGGFDVRAWEAGEVSAPEGEEDESAEEAAPSNDRLWLVQCKREKSIPPKKLAGYLDELPHADTLHGLIFAAATDFSKQARDLFRQRVRERGISEAFLWGKADIEDMLYQPKNDHLMFAYFGVSLQVRQRSLKTAVRAKLVVKRKAERELSEYMDVLIRDATEDRYPWLAEGTVEKRFQRGRWKVYHYVGVDFDGLRFEGPRHFAFIDDDGVSWDFAEVNMARAGRFTDPWAEDDESHKKQVDEMRRIWEGFSDENRATYSITLVMPFDKVIDIDKSGDKFFQGPHIYTAPWAEREGPFLSDYYVRLRTSNMTDSRSATADFSRRIQKFPPLKS